MQTQREKIMKHITMAIADDHKALRESLSRRLNKEPNITVVWEADNGKKFLEKLASSPVDINIALLDLDMPEMDGQETTKYLSEHYPNIKIIILSMHKDKDLILELIEMGVDCYMTKDMDYNKLLESINEVHVLGSSFSQEVITLIRDSVVLNEKETASPSISLTRKEKELLILICKELTNKEIADELSLSSRTVERYRQDLLAKFGVKRPVGLLLKAMQQNLIDIKRF